MRFTALFARRCWLSLSAAIKSHRDRMAVNSYTRSVCYCAAGKLKIGLNLKTTRFRWNHFFITETHYVCRNPYGAVSLLISGIVIQTNINNVYMSIC